MPFFTRAAAKQRLDGLIRQIAESFDDTGPVYFPNRRVQRHEIFLIRES